MTCGTSWLCINQHISVQSMMGVCPVATVERGVLPPGDSIPIHAEYVKIDGESKGIAVCLGDSCTHSLVLIDQVLWQEAAEDCKRRGLKSPRSEERPKISTPLPVALTIGQNGLVKWKHARFKLRNNSGITEAALLGEVSTGSLFFPCYSCMRCNIRTWKGKIMRQRRWWGMFLGKGERLATSWYADMW